MATGEWVFGDLLRDKPNSTLYYDNFSQRICWISEEGASANAPVKNGTVGQYIGLNDKNGVEIYGGDIVKNENGEKYLIVWVEDMCAFYQAMKEALRYKEYDGGTKMTHLMPHMCEMRFNLKEVIGSIYEHPHLLEGKE